MSRSIWDSKGGDPSSATPPPLIIVADGGDEAAARRLALHLGTEVELEGSGRLDDLGRPVVAFRADGISLARAGMALRGDLTRLLSRIAPGRLRTELVVRAARTRRQDGRVPTALDATAGLGEDSLLLAAAGFDVTLYERNPVVAALLRDSLRRAALVPGLADAVARMTLVEGDSVAALCTLAATGPAPDVVLLDPMFPARGKSAQVRKKAQLLQLLEAPCDDEEALLGAAVAAGPLKVVVKRPPKGPVLAGMRPSYSLRGKAVRYDCLVLPRPAIAPRR